MRSIPSRLIEIVQAGFCARLRDLRVPGPLAPEVAPRLDEVGFFLPPTPLQHLLLEQGPPLQVMTSGPQGIEHALK